MRPASVASIDVTWSHVTELGEAILGRQLARNPSPGATKLPYLRVANVQDDAIDLTDLNEMFFTPAEEERYRLSDGDILLCEGQSPELVGRCAMYRDELPRICFQNTLIRFRPADGVDPEYMLLIFRLYQRDGIFRQVSRGTINLAHLGLSRFRKLRVPAPPPPHQATIGELARAVQTQLDYIVEAVRGAAREATAILGRIRHRAILGRLPLDLLEDNLPQLSRGWEWRLAANAVSRDAPIVYGILQPGPDTGPGLGVPYIRGGELRDGFILEEQLRYTTPTIAQRYERARLHSGDVLVGLVRDPRVAVVPPELDGAHITQGIARLRPGPDIDASFLAHWVASPAAQRWLLRKMRGIDMPGLNLRDVRRLPVPVPPVDVQRAIARRLDEAFSSVSALTVTLARIGNDVGVVEHTLLEELVSGLDGIRDHAINDLGPTASSGARPPTRARRPTRPAAVHTGAVKPEAMTLSALEEALRSTGEAVTPEVLFEQLRGREVDVERYFLLLREASRRGIIAIDRPNDVDVRIRFT